MKDTMIEKAFDSINPTQAQKDRMRAAIAARLPAEKPVKKPVYQQKQTPTRRWSWLPAAAALFAVIVLGIFTISRLSAENVSLGPALETEPTQTTEETDSFAESSLYKAITEWDAYVKEYNVAVEAAVPYPYGLYGCENEEMKEKLDELCKTHGVSIIDDYGGTDSLEYLCDIAGIKTIYKELPSVETVFYQGCIYPDGSLQFRGNTTMSYAGTPWSEPVVYKFYSVKKDTFHHCLMPLANLEEYDHWEYTTTEGVQMLLAVNREDAFLFTEGENSLVFVDIGNYFLGVDETEEITMDRAAMEAFAETFDYTIAGYGTLTEDFLASSHYQAQAEWNAYLATCEETNLGVEARYARYGCQSEAMMRSLDALCEKYGLTLMGDEIVVNDYERLMDILGVDTIFYPQNGVSCVFENFGSSYFRDGCFMVSGEITMSYGDTPWEYPIVFSFHRIRKTAFHNALLEIGDLSQYDCWNYTTKSGEKVLLALGVDAAFVIADREEELILIDTADIRIGDVVYGEINMDKTGVEAFANCFDFSLAPNGGPVSIDDTIGILKETANVYNMPNAGGNVVDTLEALEEIIIEKRESVGSTRWAKISSGWVELDCVEEIILCEYAEKEADSLSADYDSILQTYEAAAKEGWSASRCLQEGISELCASGSFGYCLMDLDGNGVEELIISDGKRIYDLYTINRTRTKILSAGVYNHYTLMDGFSIRSVSDGDLGGTYYIFYRLTDGFALTPEKTVIFNGAWSAGQTDADAKPITDSEAYEILQSYAEVSIAVTSFQ